jgi:hypothetical protein
MAVTDRRFPRLAPWTRPLPRGRCNGRDNLGTIERTTLIDAVKEVSAYPGRSAEIELRPEMPTCPLNGVADNSRPVSPPLAASLRLQDGLRHETDSYYPNRDTTAGSDQLDRKLPERPGGKEIGCGS